MTDKQESDRGSRYDGAREAFNGLDLEGRITFLVQESANTVVHVIKSVADAIQSQCDTIFSATDEAPKGAEPHGKTARRK